MAALRPTEARPVILVATRVHQGNASRLVDLGALETFVQRALDWGEDIAVAIAVGSEGPTGEALLHGVSSVVESVTARPLWSGRLVSVVPVNPWGKFVNGLNVLVQHAITGGFEHVLFSSVETEVGRDGVDKLRRTFTPSDLVVGAAFRDHAFEPREAPHALTGSTTPWNTLALWHAPTLALLGFVGVAEGLDVASGRSDGGVEEVTAIALLQHLQMTRTGVKLVRLPGLAWDTAFEDDERRAWHARKMASKVSRPVAQMAKLPGLPAGSVLHIDLLD